MQVISHVNRKATCACMILVRDAPNTIIDCIESAIKSRCFEKIIIVIDTRSKDATVRILTEYAKHYRNILLLSYKWSVPGDFSAVRNYALKYAETEYGFWLDADEVLSDPAAIRRLLADPRGKAYNVWVVSPMPGTSFDMYQPRLFPVLPGVKFECPVFERIDLSLARQGVELVATPYRPIRHTGYMDAGVVAEKNRRNLAILDRWLRIYTINDEKRIHLLEQYRKLKGR